MGMGFSFRDTQMFYNWIVAVVTQLYEFTKKHFTWVNYVVCELYFNFFFFLGKPSLIS